jgi:hypothetical protein
MNALRFLAEETTPNVYMDSVGVWNLLVAGG